MEQRITAVTLGVADLARSLAFYEALGWRRATRNDDVVFFQAGGMVLALWSRAALAEDGRVEDPGGWGGVTLSQNVRSPQEVDAVLAQAAAAGGTVPHPGEASSGAGTPACSSIRRPHVGDRPQPFWELDADGNVRLPELSS
jgi:catechol 2,3-dioxygenase-like lactoylglutathione lyase family enzyme